MTDTRTQLVMSLMCEAPKQWKCPSCGGAKVYIQRSRKLLPPGHAIVPCHVCDQTGLHPTASAAIAAAEAHTREGA